MLVVVVVELKLQFSVSVALDGHCIVCVGRLGLERFWQSDAVFKRS